MVAEASQDVRALVNLLVAGDLSPAQWQDQMQETLAGAHAEAGYRGRLRAGDHAPYDRDDVRFGWLVAQEEARFLDGFRRDLEGGKYGVDEPDVGAIERRADLYVKRLYGTANEAWSLTLDQPIWWVLGETEENCRQCPRLAEASPYAPGTLPTYPRAGGTPCYGNCQCSLRASGGLEGFAP